MRSSLQLLALAAAIAMAPIAANANGLSIFGGIEGGAVGFSGATSVVTATGGTTANPAAAEARITGGSNIQVGLSGTLGTIATNHNLTLTGIAQNGGAAFAQGMSFAGEIAAFQFEGFGFPGHH